MMTNALKKWIPKILAGAIAVAATLSVPPLLYKAGAAGGGVPRFEPDPYWPKPLPHNWISGGVDGIFVDPEDHIWVLTRPGNLDKGVLNLAHNPPDGDCCIPAPPVLEFDTQGNVIQGWGGPGQGYDWPAGEQGLFIDYKGNVWIAGAGRDDGQVLKFTRDGKFLLQIGKKGKPGGSNDTTTMGQPSAVAVYQKTNEVFVADGYLNRRVIVFDADTGAYKRHWGAYGNQPNDKAPDGKTFEGPGPTQFLLPHCIDISRDGLLYVCDREHNRIQVFQPDGTFVKEGFIERNTRNEFGTAFDVAFSPDKQQKFLYVVDGSNAKVQILDRQTLSVVSWFGGHSGRGLYDFYRLHNIASDSKGNVYLGENIGQRLSRWKFKGF
jgi:DNA-binding beta-propeller fold protein YncE